MSNNCINIVLTVPRDLCFQNSSLKNGACFHLSEYINSPTSKIQSAEIPCALHENTKHLPMTGVWCAESQR